MSQVNDIYGSVEIPEGVLWGANTQRSLQNFPIGVEKMPRELIQALIHIKRAAAQANGEKGVLDRPIADAIIEASDQILEQELYDQFPLAIWQTGSGTQTNMNANEVIANLANKNHPDLAVHPNDHVNKGQSSNCVFPTALHVCLTLMINRDLIPAIEAMRDELDQLAEKHQDVLKTGRTHLQDATPVTFGQEAAAWAHCYRQCLSQLEVTLPMLRKLTIGGTAVGTGLNAYRGFGADVSRYLNENLGEQFESTENPFHGMSAKDAIVFMHGALTAIAADTMKVANDIRWLASGPRCGIGELTIPANEAGSSIMPGKVNPTQAEAITMVCVQVMANHQAVMMGASQGNFQLNVYMPMILHNAWQSIRLLTDGLNSFRERCVQGIEVNRDKMRENLEKSLMTATYLNNRFGYDQTARIVKEAHERGLRIKDVIVEHQLMTADEFDAFFDYEAMIKPYEL